MSKVVALKDVGVPVPSPAPDVTDHLICYYGQQGFTPSYTQTQRLDLGPISGLKTANSGGQSYWDVPLSTALPAGLPNGPFDFVFTLMDSVGAEGDFSPAVTETVDTTVPPTLGQPIVLG